MNTYKRLFCVLLVFVLLFVQFLPLHTVHATENNDNYGISLLNLTDDDYNGENVYIRSQFYNGNNGNTVIPTKTVYLNDTFHYPVEKVIPDFTSTNYCELRIGVTKIDNSILFSKGSTINFEITGLENAVSINDSDYYALKTENVFQLSLFFKDSSGKNNYVPINDFNLSMNTNSNYTYDLSFSAEVPCDTYDFLVGYRYNYHNSYIGVGSEIPSSVSTTDKFTLKTGFYSSTLTIKEVEPDSTEGLLGSLIKLVTNIKNGITNLPQNIANSVKGFFDNIVNAVVNLGTTILDGIKNLFVPSEEDITEMKDRWTDLLRDRFGALYQTVELIDSYGKSFQAQEKNTITMPSIDLSLAGAVFTFGGWEVQVVPEGFDVLFNALKLIISIVCTIWFVNGLKNRFEKLVGGADNI